MNLRDLVASKAAYKDPGKKPRSMALMAGRCGITRQHFYKLFAGQQSPADHTVVKIARGLEATVGQVKAALRNSWLEAVE